MLIRIAAKVKLEDSFMRHVSDCLTSEFTWFQAVINSEGYSIQAKDKIGRWVILCKAFWASSWFVQSLTLNRCSVIVDTRTRVRTQVIENIKYRQGNTKCKMISSLIRWQYCNGKLYYFTEIWSAYCHAYFHSLHIRIFNEFMNKRIN